MPPSKIKPLVERQFLVDSVRDIHETVPGRRRLRSACGNKSAITVTGAVLALNKLMILYHNIGRIYFYAILIGIASRLNTSRDRDPGSLVKILLRELTRSAKSNAAN